MVSVSSSSSLLESEYVYSQNVKIILATVSVHSIHLIQFALVAAVVVLAHKKSTDNTKAVKKT